jgi:formate-dependent nitrite reductase membrane component NrfD
MMKPQAQREWGIRVALDFFLGGAGAGLISVYLLAALLAGRRPLSIGVLATGAVLVIAGAILLASELGRPANAVRSFFNAGTSWMARGAVLNVLLIGLVVLLLVGDRLDAGGIIRLLEVLAILAAALVACYPGLVLFASRDIGLWRSPVLPLMFFVYSVTSGVSLLLIAEGVGGLRLALSLAKLELALIVVLAVLFAAFWTGRSASKSAGIAQGVRLLTRGELRGAFVFGSIGVGLILPLFCFIDVALIEGQWAAPPAMVGIVSFLLGAFLVRYCLLRAACHEPMGFLGKSF